MYPFGDDDTDPSDCEGTDSCDFNDIDSQYTEDLDDLPPYEIRKILRKTTTISLDKFCQAVFGLSSSTLDNWASQVRENRWFHDPIISKYLAAFCTPTHKNKRDRYTSLATLVNRIVRLGRGNLSGVADTYPIDDIYTIPNYPWVIRAVMNDKVVGGGKIPALITLRGRHVKLRPNRPTPRNIQSGSGIHWAHVIMCWEVDDQPIQGGLYDKAKQARLKSHTAKTSVRRWAASQRAPDSGIHKDQLIQSASDAVDIVQFNFSARQFCINVVLQADMMYLAYYDPCGCVCTSEGVSLVTAFEVAAAIIIGIANCPPDRLGAPPSIKSPTSAPYSPHWPSPSLKGHTITLPHVKEIKSSTITLRNPWSITFGLLGKLTTVYTVESNEEVTHKQMAAKIYNPLTSRPPEETFIVRAHEAGVGHIPEVHLAGNLWNMSDGVRGVFCNTESAESRYRTLRAIVLTRYLPIDELLSEHPEYIPEMASQLLDCLHDLKEKVNILHRDIDVKNVVYEERNGKPYFVLIDFDQAIFATDEDSKPRRVRIRDGHGFFMASDLMQVLGNHRANDKRKVTHYLRHDYESVFWLSLYCSAVFPAPENEKEKDIKYKNETVFDNWITDGFWDIAATKRYLRTHWWQRITLLSKAKFLGPWLDRWAALWLKVDLRENVRRCEEAMAGFSHRRRDSPLPPLPPYDWETAEGLLTRESIKRALSDKTDIDFMINYDPGKRETTLPPQAKPEDSPSTSADPPPTQATTSRKRKSIHPPEAEQAEYRRTRQKRATASRQNDVEPESQSSSGKPQRASQATEGAVDAHGAEPNNAENTRALAIPTKPSARKKGPNTCGDEIGMKVADKRTAVKKAGARKSTRQVVMKTTAAGASKRSTSTDTSVRGRNTGLPTGDSRAKEGHGDANEQLIELDENDIRRRLRPRKRI